MSLRRIPQTDLVVLDALRGLAALYVVWTHAGLALWAAWAGGWVSASELRADYGLAGQLLAQSFGYSRQAVLLFFVLSGFCIHYRQARLLARAEARDRAGGWGVAGAMPYPLDVATFVRHRARRLFPPLAVAVVATLLLDRIGALLTPRLYSPASNLYFTDSTPWSIAGGLLMQSGVLVPSPGTNGALWTLGFEFWFYALYPALLFLSLRLGTGLMIGAVVGVSLLALEARKLVGLGQPEAWGLLTALGCWFVWGCGALVAEIYAGRIRVPFIRGLGIAGAAALLLLGVTTTLGGSPSVRDLLWGVALAALLTWVLLALPPRARTRAEAASRALAPLGTISYSLYVIHLPWLWLLAAWWTSRFGALPRGPELAVGGLLTAVALGAALWYVVERHFVTPRSARPGEAASPPAAVLPAGAPERAPGVLPPTASA